MPNISQLSQVSSAISKLSTAGQLVNVLLAVPDQKGYYPALPPGFAGPPAQPLLFHYEGEQTVNLTSDITDHYIEDNTPVQDQIATKPEIVTTQGFIGELNDIVDSSVLGTKLQTLKTTANKLTIIDAFVPVLSTTALIAYNEAKFAYDSAQIIANGAINAFNFAKGVKADPTQNKQQQMFGLLYGYWKGKQLFTVYTPWNKFENMAIQSIKSSQSGDTRMISEFEVTFKKINFVQDISITVDPNNLNDRASNEAEGLTNLGTSTPSTEVSQDQALSDSGLEIP